jgi:uncharacterized protein (TIGR03435 family)
VRILSMSSVPVLVVALHAQAQQPQVHSTKAATFEVASVRANTTGDLAMPARTRGRTYTATNIPVRYLVASAYGVPAARVLGGPSWIGSANVAMPLIGGERFDVLATLPEGAGPSEVPSMLRTLLADRFALVAHTEMREAPLYALVVDRADGRLGPTAASTSTSGSRNSIRLLMGEIRVTPAEASSPQFKSSSDSGSNRSAGRSSSS